MEKINNQINRILNVIFLASIIILFMRPAFLQFSVFNIKVSITSVKNLAILTVVMTGITLLINKFKLKRTTVIDKAILLLFLWFAIGTFFITQAPADYKTLAVVTVYIGFHFACSEILVNTGRIKQVIYFMVVCASIVAAGNILFRFNVGFTNVVEKYPLWPGKQAISLFMVFSNIVTIVLMLFNWKNFKVYIRSIFISAAVLQFVCLAFSFSRGAWLTFVISFLMSIYLKYKKTIYWILMICITGMFVLALVIVMKGITAEGIKDENINQRFKVWKTTISMIKDNPITGVGPGQFGNVHLEQYREPGDRFQWWGTNYHAHNLFLQIISENGMIGGLIIAFIMMLAVKYGYIYITKEEDKFLLGTRVGVFVSYIGFLFWSLAESSYTGEFSPLSYFHINLIVILFQNIMLYRAKSI